MSPQPSRSPDRFSLAALAEDHPTAPAQGDESESLPCVNAQRGEPNLRVVDCSGARRDEEVAVEEVLIPYAHGSDPEDVPGEPPKSRWWLSSGAAVAMHVAIIGALVWVMPTPAELNLGHGELPKTMQVNFVQLEKKAEPTPQPPAAAPEPTPPKIEEPKPEPEPSTEASSQPSPSSAAPPPAPTVGQSTPGAQTAPSGSQGPAGLPSGSLNDSDIKPLRMDPPVYPRMAQARGIEGRVKVLFTITSDGRIDDIQVLESVPSRMFDREVRQAMAKWRFEPRVSGGKIVARQATKMFFFKIEKRR
ncbi:energy transducer TonB [Pseudomonas aeruginosa]|nr:energy transducer TonB [Pseudomonas aeruginosa]